tara:strand:- start:262 stop:627 length:366 start_codon:yes stop_codon:yes gene_type:complete
MNFFNRIIYREPLGKYIFLFLTLFIMNNSMAIPPGEKLFLVKSKEIDNKLNEFNSQNVIKYSEYDNSENQLKIFFGYDSEHPEESFYPDLLIINYSDHVRDLYGQRLKDMTINRKIYNINK